MVSDGKIVLRPRVVGAKEVGGLLDGVVKRASGSGGVSFALLDSEYRVVVEDVMLEVVKACHVSAVPYVADYLDCDKHSRLLWALMPNDFRLNCVGLVLDYSGRHSYNVVVVDDGAGGLSVRWVEPQSGEEVKLHSEPYYDLDRGLILM